VVVVPRDTVVTITDRLKRIGNRVVAIRRDITDVDIGARLGIRSDILQGFCQRVGPGGDQPDRGVTRVIHLNGCLIGVVTIVKSALDGVKEWLNIERGVVPLADERDTAQSVGIGVGDNDGLRAVDGVLRAFLTAILVE